MEKLIIVSGLIYVALWVVLIVKILKVKRQLKVDISCDTTDVINKLDSAQLEILKIKYNDLFNKNCELIDKINAADKEIETQSIFIKHLKDIRQRLMLQLKKRGIKITAEDLNQGEPEDTQWGEKEYENYRAAAKRCWRFKKTELSTLK